MKRVQVTQEQAEALNAHQGKMQAATVALRANIEALLKSSEVEADLERMFRETPPVAREWRDRASPLPFMNALQDVQRFQAMVATEISSGINAVLRNRDKLRAVLKESGLLDASESGAMDDVEIVVGVANPPFSQPTPEGGAQG